MLTNSERAAAIVEALQQASRDQMAGRIDVAAYRSRTTSLWEAADADGLHAELFVAMRDRHQAWLREAR